MADRTRRIVLAVTAGAAVALSAGIAATDTRPARPAGDPETQAVGRSGLERERISGGSRGLGAEIVRTLVPLAVVVALVFAVRALLRRAGVAGGRTAPAGVVDVLATSALSPKHRLSLVRLGGRLLLVGWTAGAMTTLAEVTDPAEIERLLKLLGEAQPAGTFDDIFRRKAKQVEAGPDEGAASRGERRKER